MIRPSDPGCSVRDDGRPGVCGLHYTEHYLDNGRLLHPVLDEATGYYVRPRDEGKHCHRTDGACTWSSCWACDPNYFKENA